MKIPYNHHPTVNNGVKTTADSGFFEQDLTNCSDNHSFKDSCNQAVSPFKYQNEDMINGCANDITGRNNEMDTSGLVYEDDRSFKSPIKKQQSGESSFAETFNTLQCLGHLDQYPFDQMKEETIEYPTNPSSFDNLWSSSDCQENCDHDQEYSSYVLSPEVPCNLEYTPHVNNEFGYYQGWGQCPKEDNYAYDGSTGSSIEQYNNTFPSHAEIAQPLDLTTRKLSSSCEEISNQFCDDRDSPRLMIDEQGRTATDSENSWLKKIRTGTRSRVRSPKSWEFLLRLLQDTASNPSMIRWENKQEGTFRLVNKEEIARIWGRRSDKDRKEVSYDNFARNLRYHYKTKMMMPVSEKHLVYKFGDKILNQLRIEEMKYD